jgi:hypothetical protein
MTDLERVARAYDERYFDASWDDNPQVERELAIEAMKAALQALQEPSEGMYKAAMRYLRTDSETNFWAAWQAALQHILDEGK